MRELLAQEVYLGVRLLHTHFIYIYLHKLVAKVIMLKIFIAYTPPMVLTTGKDH